MICNGKANYLEKIPAELKPAIILRKTEISTKKQILIK
jgi:hypothetical protein